MIVRDLGDAWQVVLQTDHADLSAAFARAWATPLRRSLVDRDRAPRRRLGGLGAVAARRRGRQAGQLPRRRRPRAPRVLPRRDRRDHRGGRRRGPARLDARRRHLPAALRARPGARPRARGGGAGRGGRVRRGAGGEVRRRARRTPRRTTTLLQLFDRLSLYFCMRDVEAARRPSSRATGSSRSRRGTCGCRPTRSATAPAGSRCSAG